MPSSSRVKPRASEVVADGARRAGPCRARAGPAARPGAGVAGTGRAARPQRRRRGSRGRRRGRAERGAPGVRRTRRPPAEVDQSPGRAGRRGARHAPTTSTTTAARPPPARPATPCCPRTPPHRPRSCSRAAAGPARRRGRRACPARSALALRGGRTTRDPVDAAPEIATSARDQSLVDRAAAGAAFEAVRRVELLLDHWGTAPPSALRSGGLGVRELKAAAALLHVDEPTAALLVELAAAAGMLATGADSERRPGVAAHRHLRRVGRAQRRRPVDDPGRAPGSRRAGCPAWSAYAMPPGRPRTPWHPSCRASFAAEARRMALEVLAELPPGEVLAAGTGTRVGGRPGRVAAAAPAPLPRRPGGVGARRGGRPGRRRPRRAVRPPGRSLLGGEEAKAAETLAPLLPEPVDHVLIQADLTAVAPGPARVVAGPAAAAGRRRRVARRGHGLPLHVRAPCAARSTSAGRPSRCTSSSRRCRGRRCRSR